MGIVLVSILIILIVSSYLLNDKREEGDYVSYILLIVFLLLSTNQVFLLEEEILLIVIVLFLLDCAGGLIKEVVWGVLEEKTLLIEEKLNKYLVIKSRLVEELIISYSYRTKLQYILKNIYTLYLYRLVQGILSNQWYNVQVLKIYGENLIATVSVIKVLVELRFINLLLILFTLKYLDNEGEFDSFINEEEIFVEDKVYTQLGTHVLIDDIVGMLEEEEEVVNLNIWQ